MPYQLRFSDPSKTDLVVVPDMPPGINTVDTSLSLVGRGYPNYGFKVAENFLHLLENFAGPNPPENPIEGQLWYDTSDPNNKVLRIMDGTATATRWPSANGIYQQGTDPKNSAAQGLKIGDIWVDTANNQLKIFNSNSWTTVGPPISNNSGAEPAEIEDTSGSKKFVIKLVVDGATVAIIAKQTFIPKIVIPGFTILYPGVNLAATPVYTGSATPIMNGLSYSSRYFTDSNGTVILSDQLLRKNDTANPNATQGQVITGKLLFQQSTDSQLGIDGLVLKFSSTDSSYTQLYKSGTDAVLVQNVDAGKFVIKTKSGTALPTVAEFGSTQVVLNSPVSVASTLNVTNTLTVLSTASGAVHALSVAGQARIAKDLLVAGTLRADNTSTLAKTITVGETGGNGSIVTPVTTGTYDLGTDKKYFRTVYASEFRGTGTEVNFYGNVSGYSTRLKDSTEFKIIGQITGTNTVLYNGLSSTATFITELTPAAILSQSTLTETSDTLNLLVVDTYDINNPQLGRIDRNTFLEAVFPIGMVTPFAGTSVPGGWLLCDGSLYEKTGIYSALFNVIGITYGESGSLFAVPDMRGSTTATNATTFINYIIKT